MDVKDFLLAFVAALNTYILGVMSETLTTAERTPLLNMAHSHSTTSSVAVVWTVSNGSRLSEAHIEARRTDSQDSGVSVISPQLSNDTSEYEIPDLMTNSKYEICIYAKVSNYDNTTSEWAEPYNYIECINSFTIPLIRNDSLIALFCVLGFLILMALIGCLCWHRAHKKRGEIRKSLLEEEEQEEVEEKINKNGDQTRPFLLSAAPPGDRPRSAIEDEDIPYITPPWDQIERENEKELQQQHS